MELNDGYLKMTGTSIICDGMYIVYTYLYLYIINLSHRYKLQVYMSSFSKYK